MSLEHVHLGEAELIELALVGELPECATCRGRAQELAGFLDDCRTQLVPGPGTELGDELAESAPGSGFGPGFVDRVLARTTREDLGWSGDLRLVGSFVTRRLRSSAVLRFAAASLAVHLVALPVLAWMAFGGAREEAHLSFSLEGPREQTLPAVPMEPEYELLAPDPGPEPEPTAGVLPDSSERAPERLEVLRLVRQHRSFLRAASAPGPRTLPAPEAVLGRLFLARSQGLHEARMSTLLPRAAAGLERAVLAEVLLDTWIFDARPSARLNAVLRELGGDPTVPAAERRLELLALARAGTYGLLDADGRSRRDTLERVLQRPPGPPGPSGGNPWAAWSAELERCLEDRPAADVRAAGAWPAWER